MTKPSLPELLHAAVTAVGGTERPGQVTMAESVRDAIDDSSHLLVQAGTGTGKSLGYLVPALAHGEQVVVATATLSMSADEGSGIGVVYFGLSSLLLFPAALAFALGFRWMFRRQRRRMAK